MTTEHTFDDVVASYALGALDADERIAFESHLATCPRCQGELAEYRRVVTAIGVGVDRAPLPEALKARTLARATAPSPRLEAGAGVPEARRSWGWLQAAAAVLVIAALTAYVAALRSTVNVLSRELASATELAETLRQELATLKLEHTQLASTVDVLGSPDLVRIDLRGTSPAVSATGRAYISLNQGIVFSVAGLPALPQGRVYQLWLIPPGAPAPISAGLIPVDASGGAQMTAGLPPGVSAVGTVAVTNEPGPVGSPGPTSTPLLAGSTGG
jgi:anti-sigma-K factor RskA